MSIFADYGIALNNTQEVRFESLFKLFGEWNAKMNLSAIRDRAGVYTKHFVDSLLVTKYIDFDDKRVADLGTGGGFPLLPLAIKYPEAYFHGFDSVGKKLDAVQNMARSLELNVETFHGRLEDFGQLEAFREDYDIVTTRALAPWSTLLEYALPFVKVGGTFIAYQGPAIQDELEDSQSVIKKLGGALSEVYEESLDGDQRFFIEIKKIKPTPHKYPREVGMPKKKPL